MMNRFRPILLTIAKNKARAAETKRHLDSEGINPEIYLGWDSDLSGFSTKHTYDNDNPGTNFRIGNKLTNLWLSHYSLWVMMSHQPDDAFLIMEDDVRFRPGWRHLAEPALDWLPTDWDLCHLGTCCCQTREDNTHVGDGLYRIRYTNCTHAYAVRRKALPILLEQQKIYAPIDLSMAFHAMPRLKCYAILPRVADQLNTLIGP